MTFAHVAILLSSTQWVATILVALNHFDYSCSLGYTANYVNKIMTTFRQNELYPRHKLHDLISSFLVRSRINIVLKTFLRSLLNVLHVILCDFFKFEMSQNNRDATATISHSVSIFLLNAS